MKKKKSNFVKYTEYILILLLIYIIRILPLKVDLYLAKFLALILGKTTNLRKKIILKNLDIAYPDKPLKWKENIRFKMYQNIVMSVFEGFKYGYMSKKNKMKYLKIDEKSKEILTKLNNQEKSCLVVGGHYGFFEGGGHYAVSYDMPTTFVVENQRNKLVEKLLDTPRTNSNIKIIHRQQGMKILREIKEGKSFIALLSDQDAGRRAGVFINFFNKMTATHKNVAVLALKYNLPLIFQITRRNKNKIQEHNLYFQEINYSDILSMDTSFDEKVVELVKRYTNILETEIKMDPTAYWWIHNRFKTKLKKD